MKHLITLFIAIVFYTNCLAQLNKREAAFIKAAELCGGVDSLLVRNGKWTKVEDADVYPDRTFPRSQFKYAKIRVDSICRLFRESITDLSGVEVEWYRGISGTSYTTDGPVPYKFECLYKTYYCNQNLKKILLDDETDNWHHVFVNHYNWFCDKLGDWDYKGDGRKIVFCYCPQRWVPGKAGPCMRR